MGQRLTAIRRILPVVFNRGFAAAVSVLGFLSFFLTAIMSCDEPGHDGHQVFGFPFEFYSWGGMVMVPGSHGATTSSTFSWAALIYDVLVVLAVSLVIGVLFGLWKRRRLARRSSGGELRQ